MTSRWRPLAGLAAIIVGLGGWAVSATTDAGGADPLAEVDGATTFQLRGCASCHVGPESAPDHEVGPPLDDAAAWAGSRRPGLDAAAYLEESMRSPAAFVAGASTFGMPVLPLTDDEIDALVAFLLDG